MLERSRVLITGGAAGIGLACAQRFFAEQACIGLFDLKGSEAASAQFNSDQVVAIEGNATSDDDVGRAIDLMQKAFGGLDTIVCSAGVSSVEPFLDMPIETFRRTLDINVTGPMIAAQLGGRVMQKQGAGNLVFLGSVYGSSGAPERAAYCASKAAIHNLVKSLAVELGPMGIRVNAVAPTGVRTSMIQELIDAGKYNLAGVKARCPLGRLAEPEEVAEVVTFLASSKAKMVNGIVMPVDGGWLANGYTFS